jgi:histidine ammonia-lyase/phenylalanine ammonia-lyase
MVLGDGSLTTSDVVRFARRQRPCALRVDEAAIERMRGSVRLRDELIATGQPLYGVTTGFGESATVQLNADRAAVLQGNLIQYLLIGVGPDAAPEVARATMLIRANCLARGLSGVRPAVLELLLACLRHDILPTIPERGSVGASGDLVPLAYLAEILTGSGTVVVAGEPADAATALHAHGLAPLRLEAKEGLGLVNGTAFMTAFAALAVHDAAELVRLADVCTALTVEALLGDRDSFHPWVHAAKPHPGQIASAARIRALLAGSRLAMENKRVLGANPSIAGHGTLKLDRSVQDRYSLRCAPHVIGVLTDTLDWVSRWVEIEMNSANDNPLFDAKTHEVHSGGNFYGGHISQAIDSLKTALANVGDLLDRQLALLVDDKYNRGLPANLVPELAHTASDAGTHHGFKGVQLACSALAAEALKAAGPASVHSRSTECHNQDKVSMATIAARDARTVVELVQQIVGLHLLAVCQAVDLRGAHQLGEGTAAVHALVRERVPFLTRDRRLDEDLAAVVELIRSGELAEAVAPWIGEEATVG